MHSTVRGSAPARRARAGWLVAVAGALAGGFGQAAAAQDAALALGDSVQATLALNPDVRLAARSAEAAEGARLVSGAAFDLQLFSNASGARTHTTDTRTGAEAVQQQYSYDVGLQRLFRNGLSLRPDVSLTRTSLSTRPASATANSAAVGVSATIPLLRDRGGVASVAAERAATYDHEASLLALHHTAAQRVLATVVAYWDYVAAQRRLDVFRESEDNARGTAQQTRVLVEADERTAADLTQILGNLSSRKVTRISAEQSVVDARHALGIAIGLRADDIARLALPSTDFPAHVAAPSATEALVAGAHERRPDLRAAERDTLSAQALFDGARSELRPRLDLTLGTGYGSVAAGSSFGDFVGPLWRTSPKLDASVALGLQWPGANSRARGRLLQTSSAYEQQRILRDDLQRRIASAVTVAVDALASAATAVAESSEAVRLSTSTVQAEQRKFQLGVSTLFDVIQAQDGLTNALLGQIQSERSYAVAIATLRFQAGLLVFGEPGSPTVDTVSLLTPP